MQDPGLSAITLDFAKLQNNSETWEGRNDSVLPGGQQNPFSGCEHDYAHEYPSRPCAMSRFDMVNKVDCFGHLSVLMFIGMTSAPLFSVFLFGATSYSG
ncbi:hypothetical protein NC652_001025 [Populus alba x Populus x berolinensis]|nr:hypothetical protein NC652_001025 [Populus alba x Populus x berolinensis]